jgi:hypothetical protein
MAIPVSIMQTLMEREHDDFGHAVLQRVIGCVWREYRMTDGGDCLKFKRLQLTMTSRP